jgi:hypothetical protein
MKPVSRVPRRGYSDWLYGAPISIVSVSLCRKMVYSGAVFLALVLSPFCLHPLRRGSVRVD